MSRVYTVGHGLPLMLRNNGINKDPEIMLKRRHLERQRRLYLAELQRPHLLRLLEAFREPNVEPRVVGKFCQFPKVAQR